MTPLFVVAGMLGRGGSRSERARRRLMATGAALATWFLLGAANVLALHGRFDDRLGPVSQPGTRGGTALALVLLVLPVAAFLHQSGRLAAADRERRLSALRLAGATPREVRLLGALETTRTAAAGTAVGAAAYVLLQWAGRMLVLGPGAHSDLNVPPLLCLAAMAVVITTSAVSGLFAGRHVIATPLSVTRRANRRRPRLYGLVLLALPGALMLGRWPAAAAGVAFPRPATLPLILGGGALLVLALLLSASRLVWFAARVAGRRARSAETLLAARTLEADARPWGRALGVVGLAVAIGSGAGWFEAGVMSDRAALDPFWVSSFVLVDLALLVGMIVAASALLVHRAEYLLENGPVLATLRATGVSEPELRRVLVRQALIAATPVCAVAALTGLAVLAVPLENRLWMLWPVARALLMAGLGVLAAVLVAASTRRRLRRTVAPVRLRAE